MKFLENLKMKKLRKGQKGFTLIELLVVIAILGVIAAVAVPNIISFIGSGEEEAKEAELHNVVVAVTAAAVEGGNVSTLASAATLSSAGDVSIGSSSVGAFIIGGHTSLQYTYVINTDLSVTQS
ncbi:MAG: type II secretion system protein [Dehalogenimonas sp.]